MTIDSKRWIYHLRARTRTFLLGHEFLVMDYSRRRLYFSLEINYLMSGILTVDLLIAERGLTESATLKCNTYIHLIEKENYRFAYMRNEFL